MIPPRLKPSTLITRIALALLLAASAATAQTPGEPRPLAPGQSLERELTGAESHRYLVSLQEDEFFQVRVEQKGADVLLKLSDAAGRVLATMDSPNGKEGPETLSHVAARAGAYTLEVGGLDEQAARGFYTVRREVARAATARDRRRVEVERLFVEGMAARAAEGQAETALEKLSAARAGWQELADDYLAALTARVVTRLLRAKAQAADDEAVALVAEGTARAFQAASAKFQEAARLYREEGDRDREAQALVGAGFVSDRLGEKAAAMKHYEQALAIFRALANRYWEALTLGNLGGVNADLGERQKALECYSQALLTFKALGDARSEARTLTSIGQVYAELGEKQKALEYYNQALPLRRAAGDKGGEATTLNNIGSAYSALGERQKALEYFNQALPLRRAAGNKNGEAATLNNIGRVYSSLGEKQKALDYYNQALPLLRAVGNKSGEAAALNNIGRVYDDLGDNHKALEHINRALLLYKTVRDRSGEATALSNMMGVWDTLGNRRLAVFYGKQSVNKYQELRQAIRGLEPETQKNYLRTVESSYRELADTLISEGRFAQAEQVLAMLKEEEYFEFVRRDADEVKNLSRRVALSEKEQRLVERYSLLAGRVTEIGEQFLKLDEKKRKLPEGASLAADEQRRHGELSAQLADANAAFKLFLEKELVAELGRETVREIEYDRSLQAKLRKWGAGTVALRTVVTEDRYRVILTTPAAQVDGKTEIKAADLNRKVFAFREALQNPRLDPRPLGREIYDILVKPVERDLRAAGAKTLVWSLDGTLRYVPLAALSPDGRSYLVEHYQNVVITPKTADDMSDSNAEWQALGLGVSAARSVADPDTPGERLTFSPLPGTREELLAIVRDEQTPGERGGVLPGRRFLDEEFTARNLTDALGRETADGRRKYTVVHIASHFRLGSNWSNSFLVLGDGQVLTLEQVSNSPEITFGDVELVTLSACNTAFADESNGREVDSLAEAIQTKYGKAVLATLWGVADASTSLLMREFYRLRKEEPRLTKAAALQLAQRAMIEGRLSPDAAGARDGRGAAPAGASPPRPEFPFDASRPHAHPYFWSPFVLIGNWK